MPRTIDQLTQDAKNATTNKDIYAIAVKVYDIGGPSAVYDLAVALDWKSWSACEPCEDDNVPMIDRACMVCGSKI